MGQIVIGLQDRTFQAQDGAGTPKTSPLAVTNLTEYELVRPSNARNLLLLCNQILRVYTTSGASAYFALPANTPLVLGVTKLPSIFVKPEVTGTLNFIFTQED